MNSNIKAQWLRALRSGNYQQGHGILRGRSYPDPGTEEFCCMGVLADVIDPRRWSPPTEGSLVYGYEPLLGISSAKQVSFLQSDMLAIAGLTQDDQSVLVGMNDNTCKSLSEIADYIEENL